MEKSNRDRGTRLIAHDVKSLKRELPKRGFKKNQTTKYNTFPITSDQVDLQKATSKFPLFQVWNKKKH